MKALNKRNDVIDFMIKPEILSPAGSEGSAIAAVNGGCNAIYIGGRAFNARRSAENPSDDSLKEIIRQCHLRGVKVHITLNTLYKDSELNDVLAFASKLYNYGADAFIIQDLGFFSLVREYFSEIAPHASTQLTIHNPSQANAFKKMGFKRVVLSRELNMEEIKEIVEKVDVETEVFVHGALCVSYSGRCLMSSMLGGRSGNRGCCAQPCRMEYSLVCGNKSINTGYLLSPKDTCTLNFIRELLHTGITSWKLEGRMKNPEYVYLITSLYKKYSENPIPPSGDDLKAITGIFNRGGSQGEGYFHFHSGKEMLSASPKNTGTYVGKVVATKGKSCTIALIDNLLPGDGIEIWTKGEHTGTGITKAAKAGDTITLVPKTPVRVGDRVYKSYDKELNDSLKNTYKDYNHRQRVKAELKAEIGSPLVLKLTADNVSVECKGAIAERAQNNPMNYDTLVSLLSKTGNTPFIFEFSKGTCEELYVPLSSLKELKRTACEKLEKAIEEKYTRTSDFKPYVPIKPKKAENSRLTVQVYTEEQLECAADISDIDIYCELTEENVTKAEALISRAHKNGSRLYFALPVIEHSCMSGFVQKSVTALENTMLDGYILRNIEEIHTKKPLIADYTLNTFNSASLNFLKNKFSRISISCELNLKEVEPLCGKDTEIVVYGRLPLMTTRQCPVGVHMAKKGTGKYCKMRNSHPSCFLRDRKNARFPVITLCDSCTALIMNSAPIYTADKWEDIAKLKCEYLRLVFTTESKAEMNEIISLYKNLLHGNARGDKKENTTKGHFYRGVL